MTPTDKPANVDVSWTPLDESKAFGWHWVKMFSGPDKEGDGTITAMFLYPSTNWKQRCWDVGPEIPSPTELAATAREMRELREENNLLAGRINDLGVIANDVRRERDRLIAASLTAESVEVVRAALSLSEKLPTLMSRYTKASLVAEADEIVDELNGILDKQEAALALLPKNIQQSEVGRV